MSSDCLTCAAGTPNLQYGSDTATLSTNTATCVADVTGCTGGWTKYYDNANFPSGLTFPDTTHFGTSTVNHNAK